MSGWVFLSWTSTKLGLMCLAQRHNAVTPVRLEPAALWSQVKHSTTKPLCSLQKASKYDQEMKQSQTTDQPTLRKKHTTLTVTRQQEHKESKATSSLFLSKMNVKLVLHYKTRTKHKTPTNIWSNNKSTKTQPPPYTVISVCISIKVFDFWNIECRKFLREFYFRKVSWK